MTPGSTFVTRSPRPLNSTRRLAANALTAALVAAFDAGLRARHTDWEQSAAQSISFLRTHALKDGADRDLCHLVTELLDDETFARLWDEHHVHSSTTGTTDFTHPDVGHLTLDYQILPLPEPEQWLLVYTTCPRSATPRALEVLSNHLNLVPALTTTGQSLRLDSGGAVLGRSGPEDFDGSVVSAQTKLTVNSRRGVANRSNMPRP